MDKITVDVDINNYDTIDCYFLIIEVVMENDYDNEYERRILTFDKEIIKFFNIPEKYYFNTLLGFNATYMEEELYFKNKEDAIKTKQWFEDNLDSFLIAKKLEGNF
jgi:hypothetical protein